MNFVTSRRADPTLRVRDDPVIYVRSKPTEVYLPVSTINTAKANEKIMVKQLKK